MLYASRLSITSTRSLISHAIFQSLDWATTTGRFAWPLYGSISATSLSHGHNDTLPTSGTEPRVDNLAVANLCSKPPSCTAATIGILALNVFLKDTTALYAECGHRTSNLTITIQRFNRLSYAAADTSLISN